MRIFLPSVCKVLEIFRVVGYYIRFKYYLMQCNFCWDFGESGEEMNFMMPLSYLFLFLHAEVVTVVVLGRIALFIISVKCAEFLLLFLSVSR